MMAYRDETMKRCPEKDGYPEECQVMVGVAQLAKPLGVPIGLPRRHPKAVTRSSGARPGNC